MEQLHLFDLTGTNEDGTSGNKIRIVNAQYISSELIRGKELFDGFDEMYAITYSSGIQFMSNLLDQFEYVEIIFGCEGLVDDGLAAVMAVQAKIIEKLTKNNNYKKICEKVDEGNLHLFVSRAIKSHEKVFCLKAKDGRVRVITGSANMSASAFHGVQRENIVCFNEMRAYEEYKGWYEAFREECADNFNLPALLCTREDPSFLEDNIEEIPVVQTLEKRQMLVLEAADSNTDEEYEIVADVRGLEKEFKPIIPKPQKQEGKILFTAEQVHVFKSKLRTFQEDKKIRKKRTPKLHIDYELQRMDFNGEICNLNPDPTKVTNDINCLFNLLNGLEIFRGKAEDAQNEYYAFFNWYFSSIFAPYLRYVACKNDGTVRSFPTLGIVYGDSDGGKSTFLQLLTKLMCGTKIPLNRSSDFTATNIENLRIACEGVPIVIDDLDRNQFRAHADKIIKDDEWGIADHLINYPAIVISTNKLPSLEDALSKRAIGCRISIKIDKQLSITNAKHINQCIKNVTNSLFCEYVRRMFPKIAEMVEHLKNDAETIAPDLFAVSSDVLLEIFKEFYHKALPKYVRRLTREDYFGDRVVGKNAITKIVAAWETEPSQFRIDKKKNRLIYSYPEGGNLYELKYICDELPASLNARCQSKSLQMDLDAASDFFGIKFKKSFFTKN